jgi:hypothetical protein
MTRARLVAVVRTDGRVILDLDVAIGLAVAIILAAVPRGLMALADLVELAVLVTAMDLAGLVRLAEDAFGPAGLAADDRGLLAADRAGEAGRAVECRAAVLFRRAAGRAGLAEAEVAAAVRSFAALVIALVALFIACMAVDIVLADAVALVAAEVILADAVVTFAAADETVLVVDALADADLVVRRAPWPAVMVLRVLPVERPAAFPVMLARIARSLTAWADLRRVAVWVLLCVGIDLPRVDQ